MVATEVNERKGRYFDCLEAKEYAKAAGFVDVTANAWLEGGSLTADMPVATVRAAKPD